MPTKKVLLLYISEDSGHHCASMAVEKALHKIDPQVETLNINSFNYTNPILEKVINRTYMGVIKRTPEIWDYLYDNPKVLKNTQRLRELIHKFNTGKLKTLLDEFRPDVVVCTQAFPCGMIADYKKSFNIKMPLMGILTDYAPHSYWIYDSVDRYVVPSEGTARKLIDSGVDPARIVQFGIPIDPKFLKPTDRDKVGEKFGLDREKKILLIMGGTQGLGPIKEFAILLDKSTSDLQMIIATGTNKRLYSWLHKRTRSFRKKFLIFPYAENIDELMGIATLIATKPGGITTAEALAKGVPILIVHPLPGQESLNTDYLLKEGAALKAENPADAVTLLEELLHNANMLQRMSANARRISKPDSAISIARLILELAA